MRSTTSVDGLAEFFAEQQGPGSVCRVSAVLAELPPDKAALLQRALATPQAQLYHSTIAKTLRKWDVVINDGSISRHRNGLCRCGR